MITVLTSSYVRSDLELEKSKERWCESENNNFSEDGNGLEHKKHDLENEGNIQDKDISQGNKSVTKQIRNNNTKMLEMKDHKHPTHNLTLSFNIKEDGDYIKK